MYIYMQFPSFEPFPHYKYLERWFLYKVVRALLDGHLKANSAHAHKKKKILKKSGPLIFIMHTKMWNTSLARIFSIIELIQSNY